MGKRTSYEPGTFSYVELHTTDTEDAKRFYSGLFGWQADDVPLPEEAGGGAYTLVRLDGETVAAITPQQPQQVEAGVPPHWFCYVTVASADQSAARATELGGQVHAAPFDVMEEGRMAVVADPSGAFFGLWEAKNSIGATRVNDPGCFTWADLSTSDPAAAQAFYAALFGWEFEAMDTQGGPPYWVIRHGGAAQGQNGGMRELSPEEADGGVPSNWMPYFTVPGTDAAIESLTQAGGALDFGPIDLPSGRIAIAHDPQGAVFAVFEGEVDD